MTLPPAGRPEGDLPPRPPTPSDALPPPPSPSSPAHPLATDSGSLAVTSGDQAVEEPAATGTVRQPFTRIRAAWVGVWAGLVVVVLLIIFIGQNTGPVQIHFLWLDGQIPTALALLIAGVGGAIIALAAGAARIVQLRRMLRGNNR